MRLGKGLRSQKLLAKRWAICGDGVSQRSYHDTAQDREKKPRAYNR